MFKNVPDGYNETFNKIIEDFNFFMKNNPSTVSKEFKVLTEKELQQICGGDKRKKNNFSDLIGLIFGRGGN